MTKTNKQAFVPMTQYSWVLDPASLRLGEIPYDELVQWWRKDARGPGICADRLIAAHFANLSLPGKNDCRSFDLLEAPLAGGLRAYEVKTASQGNPAVLDRSGDRGKGRQRDEAALLARQEGLYGYIIFDVAHLPNVRMIGLPMAVIYANQWGFKIPRRAIEDKLFDQPSLPGLLSMGRA